ncbi:MAG: hypothetical protein QOI16_3908 [Pseudonocardiales bacterium]|jgi:hypothetical protein|nr:hypothetical protein [Pseudonocardiales bacterium]
MAVLAVKAGHAPVNGKRARRYPTLVALHIDSHTDAYL